MRTRRSIRNQDILFKQLFQPVTEPMPPSRPIHLDMTDEEIDKHYWDVNKRTRTLLKKEAAKERLREHVRKVLAEEVE